MRLSHKPRSVRPADDDSAMPQNFIDCGREQAFLMPPSLREWLPEDHLAWFVIEAVEQMDLVELYADYRADGHGRAAYEPSMVVALLLYAYATKQRSARAIERHCRQDIASRVITANRVPDHATIARFVARHERALAELFGSVLALCARGGTRQDRGGRGRRHQAPRRRQPRGELRLRADRA
jgi:transposase